MARQEKRFELRPVDEEAEKRRPIARFGRQGQLPQKEKPVRLDVPIAEMKSTHRLEVASREHDDRRNRQPGIEALIETVVYNPHQMEENWGAEAARQRNVPWGWFALVGMILAGAVIWSLTRVSNSDDKAAEIQAAAQSVLGDDLKEEMEAARLIDRIQKTADDYFSASTINGLLYHVRQPERVRPLMQKFYESRPVFNSRMKDIQLLQPVNLDQQANFWMASVNLTNKEVRNILIEITPSGEARIDWETLVCYQPMPWDQFARTKPKRASMDFRVYLERDNFFSHEFADAGRWDCFRLTALDSDETLFGYSATGSELSKSIIALLEKNTGRKTSAIVRLVFPEGLQSRTGVLVEKLVCPRWLYIDPPQDGS